MSETIPFQRGRTGRASGPAGLVVREHTGVAIVSLRARRGRTGALKASVQRDFGLELPMTPRVVAAAGVRMAWSGPEHWLALAASAPEAFEERLHACVGDDAALCDQSDSRVVLELSGPRLLDTLAKGVGVDLHPSQFGPGCVALTGVSHIGVQIWRDESGGSFHVLVPRTYFASFWSWLSASAAEYGCEVTDAA